MRQRLYDPFDPQGRHQRGNLFRVPPLLHRQTEAGGHRRPGRALPPQVREERCRQGSSSQGRGGESRGRKELTSARASARASAAAEALLCSSFCSTAFNYNRSVHKYFDIPAERSAPADARVPASVSLGGVEIRPATVLAPMAGITDTVFRRFIRNLGGCGLMMTEFTSADGIIRHKDKKAKQYLTFYGNEHPISAQLFGSDPATLAEAARVVEGLGFDLVDLNLGCPAEKVPFTVKFRAGWSDKEIVHINLAKMAEDCGLAAVALHARTREQGYSGQAQWEWIAAVKDAVKIPVIGNGDVRSPEDAAAMVAQTGCDAVMIGRSAASNPWIFRQIERYTRTGSYDLPSDADRYHMIRTYFSMLVEEKVGGAEGKMKQFAAWFTHGVPHGAQLRKAVYESKREIEILDAVDRFFETLLNGKVPSPAQSVEDDVSSAALPA